MDATVFSLITEFVERIKSNMTLNWLSLNDERKIEYSLLPEFLRQNFICASGWDVSRSVNVYFDIKLATPVTAV
jgi:hypothetical protein